MNKKREHDAGTILYIESKKALEIVRSLLKAARFPEDSIFLKVVHKDERARLPAFFQEEGHLDRDYVFLFDNDKGNFLEKKNEFPFSFEKEAELSENLLKRIHVFFAVPQIEAWLFADNHLALQYAKSEKAKEILQRLSFPETISYPNYLSQHIFEPERLADLTWIQQIDLDRATSRSSSLLHFFKGVSEIIKVTLDLHYELYNTKISRESFSKLLFEVVPSNTIVWRTSSGNAYTAEELKEKVDEGHNIGRQYISDILRISRDLLARKAQKGK